MIYISMPLMMMMSSVDFDAFSPGHSQYLVFPSMDLADLAIRDGTPFARSIFDVYILLLDPS